MEVQNYNCDQRAIDDNWSLARQNACHIGIQNFEMGEIRDDVVLIQRDITDINHNIDKISGFQQANIWLWGVIVSCIIVLTIKQIWAVAFKKTNSIK